MEPNHNNNFTPGSELPHMQESEGQTYAPEKRLVSPESVSQPKTPVISSQSPVIPVSPSIALPGNDYSTSPSAQHNPHTSSLTADDADLIEKEWVLKAKAIVLQTREDPREQSKQMSGIKADYLKKRYNKDLKVSES